MADPVLKCRGLVKRFGGLAAVNGIDLALAAGETLGIAGANGAGKTTLLNLVGGQVRPDTGVVEFMGRRIDGLPPHRIAKIGVARTFQTTANADTLTVLENVALAAAQTVRSRLPLRFDKGALGPALGAVALVGLSGQEAHLARTLSVNDQKRLMIAAALAQSPGLLLLDEPAAGLTPTEIEETAELIGRLQQKGVSIVVVEHIMGFLARIAPERILIMHEGKRLFEGTAYEVTRNRAVRETWLGGVAAPQANEMGESR